MFLRDLLFFLRVLPSRFVELLIKKMNMKKNVNEITIIKSPPVGSPPVDSPPVGSPPVGAEGRQRDSDTLALSPSLVSLDTREKSEEATVDSESVVGKLKPHKSLYRKVASACRTAFIGLRNKSMRVDSRRPVGDADEFIRRYETRVDYDVDFLKYDWSKVRTCGFWIIDSQNPILIVWMLLIVCVLFYNLTVPLMVTIYILDKTPPLVYVVDVVFDVINVLDIAVKTRTTYRKNGILIRSPKQLLFNYITSFAFMIDFLAVIPFDQFFRFSQGSRHHAWLRANRCLKISIFFRFFRRLEMTAISTNLLGIARLILIVIVCVHANGCFFFTISRDYVGVGNDSWVYPGAMENPPPLTDWHITFAYCFYRSLVLLTTIGDELTPQNHIEVWFVIANSLVGVLIFATIFGQVGNMVKNLNSERNMFQLRRDRVKQFMRLRDVSDGLVKKVTHWFEHMWTSSAGATDPADIVAFLPKILRTEIAINVNLDSLSKVSLFKDCERGFLVALVLKLRITQFSPGDYVCRHGDVGNSMYIVKTGLLHVLSPTGVFWSILREGEVFGEVSVINVATSGAGRYRTANVISIGYSDLFCIQKKELWEVLATYPVAKRMLMDYGKKRLRTHQQRVEDARQDVVEETKSMPLDNKIDFLIDNINVVDHKLNALHREVKALGERVKSAYGRDGMVKPMNEEDRIWPRNDPVYVVPPTFANVIGNLLTPPVPMDNYGFHMLKSTPTAEDIHSLDTLAPSTTRTRSLKSKVLFQSIRGFTSLMETVEQRRAVLMKEREIQTRLYRSEYDVHMAGTQKTKSKSSKRPRSESKERHRIRSPSQSSGKSIPLDKAQLSTKKHKTTLSNTETSRVKKLKNLDIPVMDKRKSRRSSSDQKVMRNQSPQTEDKKGDAQLMPTVAITKSKRSSVEKATMSGVMPESKHKRGSKDERTSSVKPQTSKLHRDKKIVDSSIAKTGAIEGKIRDHKGLGKSKQSESSAQHAPQKSSRQKRVASSSPVDAESKEQTIQESHGFPTDKYKRPSSNTQQTSSNSAEKGDRKLPSKSRTSSAMGKGRSKIGAIAETDKGNENANNE